MTELLTRYDQDRQEPTAKDELPLNPQNLPSNNKVESILKQINNLITGLK